VASDDGNTADLSPKQTVLDFMEAANDGDCETFADLQSQEVGPMGAGDRGELVELCRASFAEEGGAGFPGAAETAGRP
jgi:hypothetical protein